jgi:hypothetical protein
MFKGKIRLVLMVSGFVLVGVGAIVIGLGAQGTAKCPPIMASLMPTGARILAGQYNSAGQVNLGGAGADLPFEHICTNSTKYPGHLSFEVQHYESDAAKLFKKQAAEVERQTLQDERKEMEKRRAGMRVVHPIDKIGDLKTEALPGGGTLLYYDYYLDCSEDGVKRSHPVVRLLGVAHTDSSSIVIHIDRFMSAEAAKAAAVEVVANFLKTDFSQAAKGPR